MDYAKVIELLIKTSGEFFKKYQKQLLGIAIGSIVTSLVFIAHEEHEKTEAEKEGYRKASKIYEKKYKELFDYISELEKKVTNPNAETERFINDILEEYELTIRKLLQMCSNEIKILCDKKEKKIEDCEYLVRLVNDYSNYRLKLLCSDEISNIYFMIGDISYLDIECIANITLLEGREETRIAEKNNVQAKFLIQTIGQEYSDDDKDSESIEKCFNKTLSLAKQNNIHTIAFPIMSTGYKKEKIKKEMEIALGTIGNWLMQNIGYQMNVILCGEDVGSYEIYRDLWKDDFLVESLNAFTMYFDCKQDEKVQGNTIQDDSLEMKKFNELGFGVISKYSDIILDGEKGYLVWDYLLYNEISFVSADTMNTKSLYKSISDRKTAEEYDRLLRVN